MFVDSGAAMSCINLNDYIKEFKQYKLIKQTIKYKGYTGTPIRPEGYFECKIKFNDVEKYVRIHICCK